MLADMASGSAVAWWVWPVGLFIVTFALGIIAVLGGVGGGVLFVPIVGGFFPFHLDFVRGAGLLLALCSALAAAPRLLTGGLASLNLATPLALAASIASIAGALASFYVPTQVLQIVLGFGILAIAALMWKEPAAAMENHTGDGLARTLHMHGVFHDRSTGRDVDWTVHRTPAGLAAFAGIGFVGGMFGLGAGWANVPALNLLMGAPLKLAVGSSGLIISLSNSSAAWVYIQSGAVLPLLAVPSILGVMLGSRIGARMLLSARSATIRRIICAVMVLAGARSLLKGFGI